MNIREPQTFKHYNVPIVNSVEDTILSSTFQNYALIFTLGLLFGVILFMFINS